MNRNFFIVLSGCLAALILSGCETTKKAAEVITSEKSAVELRAIQSRIFETPDTEKMYRHIINTFFDLGYAVLDADYATKTITAEKMAMLKMTVVVQPSEASRTLVRANAVVKPYPDFEGGNQIDSAEFYQTHFFDPLSEALSLEALPESG